MSEDVFGEMVQFLQSIGPNILPQHLENERLRLLSVSEALEGQGYKYSSGYQEDSNCSSGSVTNPQMSQELNEEDIYEDICQPQEEKEKRDYNSIMSWAVKAGPLQMKINLMRWKRVMAAVLDSELFIYKDKKSPEFVIALNDAEIRTDPRKENKFIVTSSTHKNGSYEFKGSNSSDRDTWVSILEDIAQGRDGMALNEEGENYDVANDEDFEGELYEGDEEMGMQSRTKFSNESIAVNPPSKNDVRKKFFIGNLSENSSDEKQTGNNDNNRKSFTLESYLEEYKGETEVAEETNGSVKDQDQFKRKGIPTQTQPLDEKKFKPIIESFDIVSYDDSPVASFDQPSPVTTPSDLNFINYDEDDDSPNASEVNVVDEAGEFKKVDMINAVKDEDIKKVKNDEGGVKVNMINVVEVAKKVNNEDRFVKKAILVNEFKNSSKIQSPISKDDPTTTNSQVPRPAIMKKPIQMNKNFSTVKSTEDVPKATPLQRDIYPKQATLFQKPPPPSVVKKISLTNSEHPKLSAPSSMIVQETPKKTNGIANKFLEKCNENQSVISSTTKHEVVKRKDSQVAKHLFEQAGKKCEMASSPPTSQEMKRKSECQIAKRLLEKSSENSTVVQERPKEEKAETELERMMRIRREKTMKKQEIEE